MAWNIKFLPEAAKDLKKLSKDQRILVAKALEKVAENPLPTQNGGYGKPLGNKKGANLTGFLKIKLQDAGIRIVYTLVHTDSAMLIIVIGARADDEVYHAALHRIKKNDL